MPAELELLIPDWPLPDGVRACVSTRQGGSSAAPYDSLNLGQYVGDDPACVAENRARLQRRLQTMAPDIDVQLCWIRQVHGTQVLVPTTVDPTLVPEADAIYCTTPGLACNVLTADCLPVLMAADDARAVATAHAGWRGLLGGVLEATAAHFDQPSNVSAWLGPAIGPCHFEVGQEVLDAFLAEAAGHEREAVSAAFAPAALPGKWFGDLYALARLRLARAGVTRVYGRVRCTCCEPDNWYSYRCEGQTGRFASTIMIAQ